MGRKPAGALRSCTEGVLHGVGGAILMPTKDEHEGMAGLVSQYLTTLIDTAAIPDPFSYASTDIAGTS